jgi:predicted acetyltransferase
METAPGSFTVLYTPPAAVPVKLIYSEQGKDLGYIIYHIVRDTGGGNPLGQRINVADIAYLSPSAYQAIWSCLANLDIAVRVDWNKVPEDDPLPHLLQEPRKLNTTSVDGLLARIVDVERAMLQRGYAADGEMSFEVIDELCPWNNACWQLAIRNGEVEIERRRRKFQLRMPVSTLALLYFGQLSATQAALMGRLEAADAESLEQWDRALYYKFKPACSDTF